MEPTKFEIFRSSYNLKLVSQERINNFDNLKLTSQERITNFDNFKFISQG